MFVDIFFNSMVRNCSYLDLKYLFKIDKQAYILNFVKKSHILADKWWRNSCVRHFVGALIIEKYKINLLFGINIWECVRSKEIFSASLFGVNICMTLGNKRKSRSNCQMKMNAGGKRPIYKQRRKRRKWKQNKKK